jgi:hypothetical protein
MYFGIRCAGHVGRVAYIRNAYKFLKSNRNTHLEGLSINADNIKYRYKYSVSVCAGFMWLRTGISGGILSTG